MTNGKATSVKHFSADEVRSKRAAATGARASRALRATRAHVRVFLCACTPSVVRRPSTNGAIIIVRGESLAPRPTAHTANNPTHIQ